MTAAAINPRDQALAGGLAFATHVLFLILLVFGVSWQHKQVDTAVVVDLWRDLPTVAPPKVEPPPQPVVKPEPPPPAPKLEVKPPPPKAEPAPAPKPDIALKEKLEKERKLKEQQAAEAKKLAAEKAREEAAEKKKRAEAEALKKKQAEKQAVEAAEKKLALEQQKARDALAAQQAAAAQREIDKYMSGIRNKVKPLVLVPPSIQGNPEAEVEVTLLPGGEVLNVRISKSSGNKAYDAAVESAIIKAQPLVVPGGEQFQRYFRRFTMAFRPVQ